MKNYGRLLWGRSCQGGCRDVDPRDKGVRSWMNSGKDGGTRELVWEIRSWAAVCVCGRLRVLVASDTIGMEVRTQGHSAPSLERVDMD